jgi:hypothetical protein
MKNEDLDNLMNTWLEEEVRHAPDIRPSAEVTRQLEAASATGRFSRPRWHVIAGAAAVLATAILYIVSFMPAPEPAPPIPTPVGTRRGFLPGRGGSEKGPARPARAETLPAPKKGGRVFSELLLQYQRPTARRIREFDLRQPPPQDFTLSAADNYRLALSVTAFRHVYVVQLGPNRDPMLLFPHRKYSPLGNPLPAGRRLQLPNDPFWFHLGETGGEDRLLIMASETPFRKLEDLWNGYATTVDTDEQLAARHRLVELLQSLPAAADVKLDMTIFVIRQPSPDPDAR